MSATSRYVLDAQGQPIPEPNLMVWAQWMADNRHNRHVGDTTINGVRVSTVFLGLDHNPLGSRPMLYETMIFGGEWDQHQWRYTTRAEAIAAHDQIVAAVRAGQYPYPAVSE